MYVVYDENGSGESLIYQGIDYLQAWSEVIEAVGSSGASPGYWDDFLWNHPDVDPGDPSGTTVLSTPENPDWFYWDQTGRAFTNYRLQNISHIVRFKIEDAGSVLTFGIGGFVLCKFRQL